MHPLGLTGWALTSAYLATAPTPLDTPTSPPVWLDNEQFGFIAVAACVIVLLLAVIAVTGWKR